MVSDIVIRDAQEFSRVMKRIKKFSPIHNEFRQDVEILSIKLGEAKHPFEVYTLYRSIVNTFFSMVESDLYSFNDLNEYPGNEDGEWFKEKFKSTFKHICRLKGVQDLQNEYFSKNLGELLKLKAILNGINHPKELKDVHKATLQDIDKVKVVIKEYNTFFGDLMSNFMFKIKVETQEDYHQILAILNA